MKRNSINILIILMFSLQGCASVTAFFYEGLWRSRWQKPDDVIEALDLSKGDHVADIGSGSGYFTFLIADAVGPAGKVYAVDIDEKMNKLVEKRAEEKGLANIETVLAEPRDPLLPDGSVDLIFVCDTYHHINDQIDYFMKIKKDLKPDGRVVVIDMDKGLPKLSGHWSSSEVVKKEMEEAGYELVKEYDFLAKQHFEIFKDADAYEE